MIVNARLRENNNHCEKQAATDHKQLHIDMSFLIYESDVSHKIP